MLKISRLVASSRYSTFLDEESDGLTRGEEVDLFICGDTDLGVNVIVNNSFTGLIYNNQIFKEEQISRKDENTKKEKIKFCAFKISCFRDELF